MTNDKLFGPAVMFGLGGIFAEVLKDVAFRIAPVTKAAALEMIAEIKGYAVLTGARGAAHADVDALADAIVRLSALAHRLEGTRSRNSISIRCSSFPKAKASRRAMR